MLTASIIIGGIYFLKVSNNEPKQCVKSVQG